MRNRGLGMGKRGTGKTWGHSVEPMPQGDIQALVALEAAKHMASSAAQCENWPNECQHPDPPDPRQPRRLNFVGRLVSCRAGNGRCEQPAGWYIRYHYVNYVKGGRRRVSKRTLAVCEHHARRYAERHGIPINTPESAATTEDIGEIPERLVLCRMPSAPFLRVVPSPS